MSKFNAIDLFCGAGGLSLGFQQAGFNIIVGVDNEQAALDTFALNHKGAIGLNADLSKQETVDLILKTAGNRKIDVVIAGPPCQGFSLTGPRNFDDPRNKLYLAVIEMVKQYNPKGFIIENVPGMATMYKGQVKDEVLRRFTEMGYNVDCRILKACDYGVPQMRKRLIFMGVRQDIGVPHFPEPSFGPETERPYRTCRDAISDLPTRVSDLGENEDTYSKLPETEYQVLMRGNCSVLYNHVATNHKQFVKDTIALVPEGGNYKDLPEGVGESRNFHMAFNNRKMVFDATCRILLFDICKKHGLELEEEPSYGGREYLEKQDYIRMKQKKDIASLEESIQSQIEAVNQKKYEIFEQEVQYKENSIKIIDQEKKLKAQSEEFFDNAERILQQDETLKQLEFKIEDVEKLIDDVTDEVYEKAVERIADEIEIATRKEDIKLVEDSKKWILSPERKASKREKQYALDRLDGVVKKIEYAITKTISKMKNRLLKPENKNIMVQEIKKEVKPSILKKLSEKKASITRNGETGKLNKESSLDNER